MRIPHEDDVAEDKAAEDELETLALAGLNSGESIPVTREYWEQKRRRIIERHQKTGAQ
jgi:antitoxin ParD1/3/4